MKRKDILTILIAVVLAMLYITSLGLANQPLHLTLEECIRRAQETSPQVRIARAEAARADAYRQEVQGYRILPGLELVNYTSIAPDLKGPAGRLEQMETRNDWSRIGPFTRFQLKFTQPLFTFGKIENAMKAAQSLSEASQGGIELSTLEIATLVRQLYYGRTLTEELERIADEAEKTAKKAEEKIQELLEAKDEAVNEADLYRVNLFEIEIKQKRLEIEKMRTQALTSLRVLLGIPRDQDFDVADRFLEPIRGELHDLEDYLNKANGRPDLRQLRAVEEARRHQVQYEKSSYYPQVFLAGEAVFSRAPVRPDIRNPLLIDPFNDLHLGIFVGVSMSLNFRLLRAKVLEAEAELEKAMSQLEGMQRLVEQEVTLAYSKAKENAERLQNAKESLRISREWMNAEQITFDLDASNTKDLLDAVRAYLESKAAYYETIYKYNLSYAELLKAAGMKQ